LLPLTRRAERAYPQLSIYIFIFLKAKAGSTFTKGQLANPAAL
jgi:hypothetical protein